MGCKTVAEAQFAAASEGKFCLTVGGDHSIGIGTVAGILKARPNLGVVWVDAHADINTPATSPSGNIHGMPIGFLMKKCDVTKVPGLGWLTDYPRLDPSQVCYVGLRDIDAGERKLIRESGIKTFTMQDIDRYGIGKVMEMVLHHLRGRPLHLSFDIDACDPALAPATGTVVRGGLTYREANYVAEATAETSMLGSMDMVEVNPHLSVGKGADETAQLGLVLTASALGSRIL